MKVVWLIKKYFSVKVAWLIKKYFSVKVVWLVDQEVRFQGRSSG